MTQTHINIAMLAHVDAGKTTLSEALLYKSGSIRKAGRVDNKDAFLDTNEMERNRGITIFSKQAVFSYGGCEFTLCCADHKRSRWCAGTYEDSLASSGAL